MEIEELTVCFSQYGAVFVFVIVLLEYMNLPGFPAGVIMPLAGIWASQGEIGFVEVMFLSVAAGLLGSWILYFLGRWGGEAFLKLYIRHFPKQEQRIRSKIQELQKNGAKGVFVAKLLPMVRTLISIPAGMISMDFRAYTFSSLMGVFVWNLAFVGAGYVLGESFFTVFS